MANNLSRDLLFLILQYLDEEKFRETLHMLEQESGLFFNFKYIEELVLNGIWDEAERYLLKFTRVDDNKYSMQAFFEIRKQKYLEALDKFDRAKAVDILVNDLKVFASFNEELFKEIAQLLTLDNFREKDLLSTYRDTKTARANMLLGIKRLFELNPVLCEKMQFPNIKGSRLRALVNQSLNWQHALCANPRHNPDIRTLIVDHKCRISGDPLGQLLASNQSLASTPKVEGFLPIGPAIGNQFHPSSTSIHTPFKTWRPNSLTVTHPEVLGSISTSSLAHPGAMAKGLGGLDEMYRMRMSGISNTVMQPAIFPSQSDISAVPLADELPRTVAQTINLESNPTSMDFHPLQQILLLVGTDVGDISLWEVSSRKRLVSRNFQVWDFDGSSMALKASVVKDPCVSVRRILWNPNGSLFGVAYSKHIMQLYTYHGGNDIRQHLEIDAHIGSVNDLAFCNPIEQLWVITCGDDKTIKVWDVATGARLHIFEGHDAAVYSVCPNYKENIHFVFSTSVDGKIKAWLYDNLGSRVDYEAPGRSCTTMAYSADGKRLFSCGTSRDGESHIVEWNDNDGTVKRSYQGFCKNSLAVVQFDTTKDQFLAAGDDFSIKFWNMDNINLLISVNAEGGLPARPRIRFNKEGTLLAVSARSNTIKVLATGDGLCLMRMNENQNGETRIFKEVKPKMTEEVAQPKIWMHSEFSEATQIRSLRLSSNIRIDKISRLIYTNAGNAILALSSNAFHLYWRWPRSDVNPNGKATTKDNPQFVNPMSGTLMTNDITDRIPGEAVPCLALSKNDFYAMSACGGKISLFNMLTFKTMMTFMSPPPAATCLAFHPKDNNIIAVGMDDNSIHIFNVRIDEVTIRLEGHTKRISSLAFSHARNVLISSGADAQIILWNSDRWEKENTTFLQIPVGRIPRTPLATSYTYIQFHQDQIQFLAVHETQLAIYEIPKPECVKQWFVGEFSAPISHATFSSDSQIVYASFVDGVIRIFSSSSLELQCQINPSAYLPSEVGSSAPYPLVIAAHPQDPNQFAIGLTDGGVQVFEPLESEEKWGITS